MTQAPVGFGPAASAEVLRKIERLVAFVDGAIESEKNVERHPLTAEIRNWAPWNVERLVDLSDALTIALQHALGFDRVRRLMGQPEQYEDAICELALAAEFLRAGFRVTFIPEVKDKKTADLLIESGGEEACIEITQIGPSAETKEMFSYFQRQTWRIPEFESLDVEIRLHKFVSEPRVKEILGTLAMEAREVKASGMTRSFSVEGLLSASMSVASVPGSSSMRITGFPLDADEIGRLIRTIRRKAAQLAPTWVGMLVVVDNELHVSPWEHPSYSPVVLELEEYVFEHPQLAGVLIVLPFQAPEAPSFVDSGDSWVAWRKIGPVVLVEDRILIRNRYAKTRLHEKILAALGCPVSDDQGPAMAARRDRPT
jgi:hypothetical protein